MSNYFSKFGEVDKAYVIYHHKSGESRGFGFVEFVDKSSVERTLKHQNNLILEGSKLDVESVVLKAEVYNNNVRISKIIILILYIEKHQEE